MQSSAVEIFRFFARAMMWLLVGFACWYFAWQALITPPVLVSKLALNQFSALTVTQMRIDAAARRLQVSVDGYVSSPEQQLGISPKQFDPNWRRDTSIATAAKNLTVEISPLHYAIGLPLFFALVFAARERKMLAKLLLGTVVILLAQSVSVTFDVLQQLVLNPTTAMFFSHSFSAFDRNIIALGYQLGSLILPTVIPVVLWVAMHKKMLLGLMAAGAIDDEDGAKPAKS
jgi:hypothetical protein